MVYLGALPPDARFLTVGVGITAVLEVLMHLLVFNVDVRSWYDPGLLTALLGLLPLTLWYFSPAVGTGAYAWVDLGLGFVWVMLNYRLGFCSPLYQWVGAKKATSAK